MGWNQFDIVKPKDGQVCLVSADIGAMSVGQHVAVEWSHPKQEFVWVDGMEEYLDPFPSELVTHWKPFPEDPGVKEEVTLCPFCGEPEVIHMRGDVGNLHWAHCKTCKAEGPVGSSWDEAKELWKMRFSS